MSNIQLLKGDCLELMKDIPSKSIDMILCDLPYGVLNKGNPSAKWDQVIPFQPLWEQYKRIIKDNGAIVLFGSGMFTADLMQSNRKMWRYNLIWDKNNPTGFLNANRMPLRSHEDICVFYKKLPTYNPQMSIGNKNHNRGGKCAKNRLYGTFKRLPTYMTNEKYPKSIIQITKCRGGDNNIHPTQKPVSLCEWLIKTYSNVGETVLDNCMGGGTTAIACIKTGRNFIGMEITDEYFDIAQERIKKELENSQV